MAYTIHNFQDGQVLHGNPLADMDEAIYELDESMTAIAPVISAMSKIETGTKTLTNSLEYPFNNSASTVALATAQDNTSYSVDVDVTSYSGGSVGEIIISNRATNGFTIEFTGSATSVTVSYIVRGGYVES